MPYQVRLFRADGDISIFVVMNALGASDATSRAQKLLDGAVTKAEIWHGDMLVNTVYAANGVVLPWPKRA